MARNENSLTIQDSNLGLPVYKTRALPAKLLSEMGWSKLDKKSQV